MFEFLYQRKIILSDVDEKIGAVIDELHSLSQLSACSDCMAYFSSPFKFSFVVFDAMQCI